MEQQIGQLSRVFEVVSQKYTLLYNDCGVGLDDLSIVATNKRNLPFFQYTYPKY